jgi:catechol 2,3-dioxygenase
MSADGAPSHVSLDPATTLGPARLIVADLDRAVRFYTEVLGFAPAERTRLAATLTAGGIPWLELLAPDDVVPRPPHTTGLYHVAILTPSRAALARTLRRLVELDYALHGATDHGVSEALYLADPDGNGLEIYRDRPPSDWLFIDGKLEMLGDPLDLEALLLEGLADERSWAGLDPATRVGHIHLQVAELEPAIAFYQDVLGFDMMLRRPQAAFLSAGGYHHHVAINVWDSAGAPPPPAAAVGLHSFTVVVPDAAELARVVARLQMAGVAHDEYNGTLVARDPSGNAVLLRPAR